MVLDVSLAIEVVVFADNEEDAEGYALTQFGDYPEWVLEPTSQWIGAVSITQNDSEPASEYDVNDYEDWKELNGI